MSTATKRKPFKDDGRTITEFPVNTLAQVPPNVPIISYCRSDSRSPFPDCTRVWMKNKALNNDAHWKDRGAMSFSGKRAHSLPLAMAWAHSEFGVTEWQRNAWGDYIPADVDVLPLRHEIEKKRAKKPTP